MEYQIRKAKIEDLEQIKTLLQKLAQKEHDEFDETINPDYAITEDADKFLRHRIEDQDNSLCLVVLDNEKIIGYFAGGISAVEDYRFPGQIGEGESILIEAEYRSQGLGTKFLTMFEAWCKEKGLKRMKGIVSAANKDAIKLYKRFGFEDYDLHLEKKI